MLSRKFPARTRGGQPFLRAHAQPQSLKLTMWHELLPEGRLLFIRLLRLLTQLLPSGLLAQHAKGSDIKPD